MPSKFDLPRCYSEVAATPWSSDPRFPMCFLIQNRLAVLALYSPTQSHCYKMKQNSKATAKISLWMHCLSLQLQQGLEVLSPLPESIWAIISNIPGCVAQNFLGCSRNHVFHRLLQLCHCLWLNAMSPEKNRGVRRPRMGSAAVQKPKMTVRTLRCCWNQTMTPMQIKFCGHKCPISRYK